MNSDYKDIMKGNGPYLLDKQAFDKMISYDSFTGFAGDICQSLLKDECDITYHTEGIIQKIYMESAYGERYKPLGLVATGINVNPEFLADKENGEPMRFWYEPYYVIDKEQGLIGTLMSKDRLISCSECHTIGNDAVTVTNAIREASLKRLCLSEKEIEAIMDYELPHRDIAEKYMEAGEKETVDNLDSTQKVEMVVGADHDFYDADMENIVLLNNEDLGIEEELVFVDEPEHENENSLSL